MYRMIRDAKGRVTLTDREAITRAGGRIPWVLS
jgi:hypothetical protein